MEDVFELLRQRTGGLAREAIDTLLSCLDALSGAVDAIESDGTERLDPESLIQRLRALVRPRSASQVFLSAGGAILPHLASAAQEKGVKILHVQAALADDVSMPAARAHMVLAALSRHGELLGSMPAQDAVEQFDGRALEAWVASEDDEEAVADSVRAITDVATVAVTEAKEATPEASAAPAGAGAAAAGAVTGTRADVNTARTVRINAERLDDLLHAMGELVIHRTAVEALTSGVEVAGLQQAMQELTRSSQALQAMVMRVRMIPVEIVFLRFPRLVRDVSMKLEKQIELKLVGSETELDRTVVDALGDPLMHLVRNSLDHGIEPPAQRIAAGKPAAGTIEIAARHAGGSVIIEVRDDGRGVDPEAVAQKALSQGLIDVQTAREVDMRMAVELLFTPGFSTVGETSDISGRGVGLDAVRAKIRRLGGEVLIESFPGKGTHAEIRLPLTLAIVSALQVEIGGAPFAIPIDRVQRTLRLSQQALRSVAGQRMLMLDDGVVPVLDGTAVLGGQGEGEHDYVVIVQSHNRRLALTVDDLVGQRELVTGPLPAIVSDGQPVSAGAALADGRIALIVDCDALDPSRSEAALKLAA
jgi:two-component system chemotaxis sensor kinase CheA